MHDVLDVRDLVPDEAEQLATSGHAVGTLLADARDAARAGDLDRLASIDRELRALERDPSWPYVEPIDEDELVAGTHAAPPMTVDGAGLERRIRGAWLGRAVGNTLGKPVEGLTRQEVERYARAANLWPQAGYLPLLDPLPEGVSRLHPSAPIATAGNFVEVPRDDDIDWTILNLHLLELHGSDLTTDQVLAGWLDRMPFTQTYTAERAAYRNAIHGLRPPETATRQNPYREWIGALIRADAFGFVHPGDPGAAARLALIDGRLSHVGNGLYGELWAAALVAAALAASSAEEALRAALPVVPPGSRLADVLNQVLRLAATGVGHEAALDWVDQALGQYSWVHTLNNAALISIGLLWGRSFTEACAISISGGRDTDSTAATVGSVFGAIHGEAAIPRALVLSEPVRIRSAIRGYDRVTIDDLAESTLRLARA